MPNYKMVDADALDGAMLATAEAIRTKGGTEELIAWNKSTGYKEAIEAIKGGASGMPEYTYTGTQPDEADYGDGNWYLTFKTSGTFTPLEDAFVDVFLVGGGGGGGTNSGDAYHGAGGGGGGRVLTERGVSLKSGEPYTVEIGAGGAPQTKGGTTSAFGQSASGGEPGIGQGAGDGGSGGGAKARFDGGGNGGSDGSDGKLPSNTAEAGTAGKGSGTTTREFGESNRNLYAGGGAGGGGYRSETQGTGGSGGGGNGGYYKDINGSDGVVNTGGGGGGGAAGGGVGGTGGSGIVVIRNARE